MVLNSVVKNKFFEIVDNYIKNNKISHAYLIEVGDYENDYLCVLEFIKMILCNCTRENLDKYNGNICNLVDSGNYPDLKIIEADGAWIKKQQLLDLMEEFQNKSLLDNKRIYIIKEAEKLNSSSANTILKFLEEPEDGIVAILLTKNRFQVIETILSRCQILNLKDEKEVYTLSEEALKLLTLVLEKENLFINFSDILENVISDKVSAKKVLTEISEVIISYMHYLSLEKIDMDSSIIQVLGNMDNNSLVNILTIIEEEMRKLEYNINYKLWLDCLFARIILGG